MIFIVLFRHIYIYTYYIHICVGIFDSLWAPMHFGFLFCFCFCPLILALFWFYCLFLLRPTAIHIYSLGVCDYNFILKHEFSFIAILHINIYIYTFPTLCALPLFRFILHSLKQQLYFWIIYLMILVYTYVYAGRENLLTIYIYIYALCFFSAKKSTTCC